MMIKSHTADPSASLQDDAFRGILATAGQCRVCVQMSAAAREGAGDSKADGPSSSAASAAANGASSASSQQQQPHHHQDTTLRGVLGVATLMPRIAQHVTSYSQLAYFRLIDTDRQPPISPVRAVSLTPDVLLPILMRLLPIVVASLGLGVLVEVPIPQLTQGVAVTLATRALIKQLSRRLWMMERGGKWARWKPVLEKLYLLRFKRPLVLGDDNFGVFGRRAAFMSETEAVRQWRILSWRININQGGHQTRFVDFIRHQTRLMDGHSILESSYGYQLPTLLSSASPNFPHAAFDPADPPTQLAGYLYPTYTSMVAFILFGWLRCGRQIRRVGSWATHRRDSAEYLRLGELLAASHSDVAHWRAAVFDKKREDGWHCRLVVFGSETMGEGQMTLIRLTEHWPDWGQDRYVEIETTESAPHDQTLTVVMRVLGDQLGGMVL
ncbi:unnamed protein product [Vitrella brassicaformis CCMP3155]|uniref:Uncharacterized protein n=1 Tax=Vitrella brassicaformis (strain CCMP3155) TaxID=1169540 RepID=A0A0G4EKF7_VITBC|nr:unnamed protein product [Vitrella brassicaformis CCMP3155]|eukprot:CEL97372.1 unnamed protein product [Vitrella brassicaformis CCMP3155]